MTPKKVNFISLGCSKNLVDTEHLMRQFKENGYTVTCDDEKSKARIVIINTCGFILDAKEESINTILEYAQRKKQGLIDRLFVMGCLSQRYLGELSEEIQEVDRFYGKFDYNNILKDLEEIYHEDIKNERVLTTPKHYAYIKIAEGCNRTCSYCAIPLITGKYQSRTIEDIQAEVEYLVKKGVKEFQIIAQDISYYGYDIYKKYALADLIRTLSDIPGVEWIRLHYAYPTNFPFEVLEVMKERKNVCHYLDIALQHSSDNMLKKMRRGINKEKTVELLQKIRQTVPDIYLRTTLMVGHPGEEEEDFQDLIQFVKEQKFERMGAFTYSAEEDTYSYKHYQDDIPEEVKQARLDQLMRVQEQISYNHGQTLIGNTLRVIIDRMDGDYYVGRSEYSSPEVDTEVLIHSQNGALTIGNFYNVTITKAEEFDFFGEIQK